MIVLSDDDSRVVLIEIPRVLGSDYINASLVTVRTHHSHILCDYDLHKNPTFQGYNGNHYIVTQGIWDIAVVNGKNSKGLCQGDKPGTGKSYTDVCLCDSAHTSECVVDGLGATAAH